MPRLVNPYRFGVPAVPNFSLVMPAGVYIDTGDTLAEVDAYPIGCSFRMKGARLADPNSISSFGTLVELMAGHLGFTASTSGSNIIFDYTCIATGPLQSSDYTIAEVDVDGFYTILLWHDTGESSDKQGFEVWDPILAKVTDAYGSSSTPIPAPTGFKYFRANSSGSGGAAVRELEIDWIALWSGRPPAPVNDLRPVAGTSGLIDCWSCDEGSGSTIAGDEGHTLSVTGSNSWNSL